MATARAGRRGTGTAGSTGRSRSPGAVWMHYARIYGPENVRGGDVTIMGPIPPRLLPQEFGGDRRVNWG